MTLTEEGEYPVRKRVWVQNVAVSAALLRSRLVAIEAERPDDPRVPVVAASVRALLQRAEDAAYRENPVPTRWAIWWRGTLIEAAYQHLHAAEAELCTLYGEAELGAEAPEALARVEAGLSRDDPRVTAALRLLEPLPLAERRALLRKVTEVGYAAADRAHSRLRSFRNAVLVVAGLVGLFVGAFLLVVVANPAWVPFCFPQDGAPTQCPTGAGDPSRPDALVVALLGLTGGTAAAAVSVRTLRGTSTPYDVPLALAALKVPFGALTALVGLVAIRGEFVPGLTALDSQGQILAYALLLGYAQQAFTTLIDRRGQDLLDHTPSKSTEAPRPVARALPAPRASLPDDAFGRRRAAGSGGAGPAAGDGVVTGSTTSA